MTAKERLIEMLTYRRPNGSKSERKFIKRFIAPTGAKPDGYGNYILRIGTAPILWSSHTDTVHWAGGRQTVKAANDIVSVVSQNCLGADCTAGVWLMLQMIEAQVEGLYIFHRAEESGGRGARHILSKTPEILDGIKYAIAFDRYGYKSVITHQFGVRTASDAFGRSMIDALKWDGLDWELDDGGTFTDTEVYADLIPECTNISVGYHNQHTSRETQDLEFIIRLRDTLVEADFTQLACERDPKDPGNNEWYKYYRDYGYSTKGYYDDDDFEDRYSKMFPGYSYKNGKKTGTESEGAFVSRVEDMVNKRNGRSNYDFLVKVIKEHPTQVADYLDMYGITGEEILKEYDLIGKYRSAA